mgnify:CR=1 FL=1|jgi:hypothetical protein
MDAKEVLKLSFRYDTLKSGQAETTKLSLTEGYISDYTDGIR